jgi:hypothetical protein
MLKSVTKYNFFIKSFGANNSMHIFSQMNGTFSETLERIEKENAVYKPHVRAIRVEIKNNGSRMQVYE